jgi:hypothetical protein
MLNDHGCANIVSHWWMWVAFLELRSSLHELCFYITGSITCLLFDSLGKYVLAGGEKHVHVFHNVTGYCTTIASIQAKIRQPVSSAQKERMEQQIQEAKSFLKSIGQTI